MSLPSLIPYLDPSGSRFYIRLSPWEGGASPVKGEFPEPMEDALCLTRILPASLLSDAQAEAARVFLVFSSDDYSIVERLRPSIANPDLDRAFSEAFEALRSSGTLIPLASQVDGSGTEVPFDPLFVCTHTRRFFSPPCPSCGNGLELARDDEMLGAWGLMPYTSSLRRYLWCRACAKKGAVVFYALHKRSGEPGCVRSAAELVSDLKKSLPAGLPCSTCDERGPCLDSDQFPSRVRPVSFYPFHLFVVPAGDIVASDFLGILSGASPEEIEAAAARAGSTIRARCISSLRQRLRRLLFHGQGTGRFLEVLYLKLAFLCELGSHVLKSCTQGRDPCLPPDLDKVWVEIPQGPGRLPQLWHFRVAFTGVNLAVDIVRPPSLNAYAANLFGMLWFRTLVSPNLVETRELDEALSHMLHKGVLDTGAACLCPGKIFWHEVDVREDVLPFWHGALELGWKLLSADRADAPDLQSFESQTDDLCERIRRRLFDAGVEVALPREETGHGARRARDRLVAQVIRSIRASWELSRGMGPPVDAARAEPRGSEAGGAADLDATVAIAGAPGDRAASPELMAEAGADLDATIALGPEVATEHAPGRGTSATGSATDIASKAHREGFTTETVVLRPAVENQKEAARDAACADMDETVVMGPAARGGKDATAFVSPPAGEGTDKGGSEGKGDVLDETVVAGPGPGKEGMPPGQERSSGKQGLDETVVMKPKKT